MWTNHTDFLQDGKHAAYLVAGSAGLAVIDPPALKTNGAPLTDEKNDMTVGMRPAAGIIILPFIQHAVQPYSYSNAQTLLSSQKLQASLIHPHCPRVSPAL